MVSVYHSHAHKVPLWEKPHQLLALAVTVKGELWLSPNWNKEARFRNRGIGVPQNPGIEQDQPGRYIAKCGVWSLYCPGNTFQARHPLEQGQKSRRNEEYKLVQEPNQHLLHRSGRFVGTKKLKKTRGLLRKSTYENLSVQALRWHETQSGRRAQDKDRGSKPRS